MKKIFSVLSVLIALAVLFCIPVQAAETDKQYSLQVINYSGMEDVTMTIGVGDEITLKLQVEADTLSGDSIQIMYDQDAFSLTNAVSEAASAGLTASYTDNTADGILTVDYTVQTDPVEKEVLLYTFKFKATATISDKYYSFMLVDPDAGENASMDAVRITVNHVHVFDSWKYTVQPGLNEKGEKERTCSVCSFKETEEVAALSYNLKLKQDAQQILYDISEDIYYAIKPGCTVSELLAKFSYDATVKVLDSKNAARDETDFVCTGDKLVVYSAGNTVENEALLSVCGDSDGNGKITATDARNALRASVNLYKDYSKAVDYAMDSDNDNKVQSSDARFLLRVSVSLDAFYPIEATSVTLNKAAVSVYTDESVLLTATVQPVDTSVKGITWTSSDPKVATVNAGRITGVSAGTCVITASTRNGKQASCNVTVRQSIESFKRYRNTLYIPPEVSLDLTRYFKAVPANAYLGDCTWKVDNDAFTLQNGILICKRAYDDVANKTAIVTLTSPGNVSVSFNVTLIPADASYCILNREVLDVPLGQIFSIGNFGPAAGRIVAFVSDNPSVVKVNEENKLVAVSTGTAKITIRGFDYSTTCTVSVKSDTLSIQDCEVDKSEGVSAFVLRLTNTSQKTISTMRFYAVGYTPSGAVYKEIYCEITNLPVNEGKSFTWTGLWGNTTAVSSANIKDITVVFSDGTKQSLTTDQLFFE